jgi:DNA-binding MarR family transcriptional regulator
MKFGERLKTLQLTPPDAGVLRMLSHSAGLSQQELSARLHIHPSRLVAILDELENRGLVERKPQPDDRRQYALHLTVKGGETLAQIGKVSREHQEDLCSSLTAAERDILSDLLRRIADQQDLTPGVHPGYSHLKPGRK